MTKYNTTKQDIVAGSIILIFLYTIISLVGVGAYKTAYYVLDNDIPTVIKDYDTP